MKPTHTNQAPAAIGPYSQAVIHNDLVYTSGQIALIPDSMELANGGVEAQCQQVLQNLDAVLASAGTDKNKVIKATIYLADMNDFPIINNIYADYFGDHKPARATVEVSRLPKDALVEIEFIAAV